MIEAIAQDAVRKNSVFASEKTGPHAEIGKMKKFTCTYLKVGGGPDYDTCQEIAASSAEEAAQIYAQRHPSKDPRIDVSWGVLGGQIIVNPTARAQEEEARAQEVEERTQEEEARAQEEAFRIAARVESLKELESKVENTNGNLGDLSYDDLSALIENLRDFRDIREELGAEECAVRERLYMKASFDSNLQAFLQTEQAGLQTSLLNQIASGQPTAGAASSGQSNLARNAAMVGGLAALQKLNQIEENTGDVSEGFGFD